MKEFYKSFTFMISFMVLLVFINMGFGAKFTEKFLWLVLASMVVMNTDKLEEIAKGLSNTSKETSSGNNSGKTSNTTNTGNNSGSHISSSGESHGGRGGSY